MTLTVLIVGSLLAQTPDRSADLAAVREYALNYSAKLPNYTTTQTVRRVSKPSRQSASTEVVEEQISYVEGRELHKILTVNGRAVKEWESDSEGMYSRGEFAFLLPAIFRPETRTEFRFDKLANLNGRRMQVWEYSVPQLPNGYGIKEGQRTLLVPYKGAVWADAETHTVARIEVVCNDIPQVSQYRRVELTLDYKAQKVAGQEFILPARYTTVVRLEGANITMDASYKDYKRFSAEATIIFEEESTSVQK